MLSSTCHKVAVTTTDDMRCSECHECCDAYQVSVDGPEGIFLETKDNKNVILVWRFKDAPRQLRELSHNGGDEDWVVFVPKGLTKDTWSWSWLDKIDTCHEPQEIQIGDGKIFIGSHA